MLTSQLPKFHISLFGRHDLLKAALALAATAALAPAADKRLPSIWKGRRRKRRCLSCTPGTGSTYKSKSGGEKTTDTSCREGRGRAGCHQIEEEGERTATEST